MLKWDDTRWVRLYAAPDAWAALPWQGQAIAPHIRMALSPVGRLDLCGQSLAFHVPQLRVWPSEVVQSGLQQLIAAGWVVVDGQSIFDPYFEASESARKSDSARQRESRARARAAGRRPFAVCESLDVAAFEVSQNVTGAVTNCDNLSRNVTGVGFSLPPSPSSFSPSPSPSPSYISPSPPPTSSSSSAGEGVTERDRSGSAVAVLQAAGWRRKLYPRELALLDEWLRVIPLADICNAIAEDTQRMAPEGGVRSLGFWRWRMSKMVDAALAHRRTFLAPIACPQPEPELEVARELEEIAKAVPWPEIAVSVRGLVDLPAAEVETRLEQIECIAVGRAREELEGQERTLFEEELSQALRACSSLPPDSVMKIKASLEKQILRSWKVIPVFSVFPSVRGSWYAA